MNLPQDDRTKEAVSEKEEIKLFYKNMRVLNEVGQQITSTHDFETIFVKLRESVNRLMDAECFGVRIYHPDKNEVEVKYEYDKNIRTKPFSFSMDNDNNFSVWCIKNKKEIFINDNLTEHKKYVREIVIVQGEMTESLIFCPMILKDNVIGVLTVQSYKKHQYTHSHLNIMRTLSSYAAIALQNARLYGGMESDIKLRTKEVTIQKEELEKSFQSVKLLSEIGQQITSCLSVEKIIKTVYANVNQLMDASSFWIGIYNSSAQRLDYPMGIEKGKNLPFVFYNLTEDNRLPVWSFKNRKEVFVNNYLEEYHNYIPNGTPPMPVVGESPESSIWHPLISKDGKTFGILTIQSFQKNSYTEYHLNIVRNLAVFTSIALENALLYEQVEQKVKERTAEVVKQKEKIELSYENIQLLSEIGQQITAMLSVETIIEKVYEKINKLMDASVFCIGIFNSEHNRLDFLGDMEKGEKLPFNFDSLEENIRPSVLCFKTQKEIIINDLFLEYNIYFPDTPVPKPVAGEQVESLIYIPLVVQDKKIGVLSVQSFKKNAYTDYHISIVRNLAVYVSIALENARLYGNMEAEVRQRTKEVMVQKEELSQKNKDITDSINYAMKIQRIILPSEKKIKELLPESFVLYMPKDIVSGDFYWVGEAPPPPEGGNEENFRYETADPILYKLLKDFVKEHRSEPTEAENIFWQLVREKNLGYKFRRQHIIGQYIADFICLPHKLVIEIDGLIHELPENKTSDEQRTHYLNKNGFHVIRFTNNEVIGNPEGVINKVLNMLKSCSSSENPPSGGRGAVVVAAVDCTGHGVPGAFLTIVGNNLLNHIINELHITNPKDIINEMNSGIINRLALMNTDNIRDGMDMAVCTIDRKNLLYSGAYNPLYYIRNNQLMELPAIRYNIGSIPDEQKENVICHTIAIKKRDMIYLFSDGYADQMQHQTGKKFMKARFKQLLLDIHKKPAEDQKQILEQTHIDWKGDLFQTDDILIMGFRF